MRKLSDRRAKLPFHAATTSGVGAVAIRPRLEIGLEDRLKTSSSAPWTTRSRMIGIDSKTAPDFKTWAWAGPKHTEEEMCLRLVVT
jgi:uroporphyrinogen-III decarboxylase